MLVKLVLLFTLVPLVELYLLFRIADWTGSPELTFGLVIATGVLGAFLSRQQGFQVLRHIRGEVSAGRLPTDALIDGCLILVAAALLVTPGVLTDAVGFWLLIPPLRRVIKSGLVKFFRSRSQVHTFTSDNGGPKPQARGRDVIIDSYVVEQDEPPTQK